MMRGLLASLLWLAGQPVMAAWMDAQAAIMGTQIEVQLWSDDAAAGDESIAAVFREMHRIDALMSPYREDSELFRVNRDAAQAPVVVSGELFQLLVKSRQISELTEGAFDITFASVGVHYDYRNQQQPSEQLLQANLPRINYHHVILDPEQHSVRFAVAGVRIDLGGIAKGYAVDTSISILQQRGVKHALISAGGDSRMLGDRRGRPWHVGIRDPRNRQGMAAMLPLTDSALSTSGDYERYFEADGIRYHHILNPATGKSATSVQSVSILGPDTTTTDAVSTSVFVMGTHRGMALVNSLPQFEAVIIDHAGVLSFSNGLLKTAITDSYKD